MKPEQPVASRLLTEDDLRQVMAAHLDGRRGQQGRAAADLGITQGQFCNVVTCRRSISPELAEALGYRRVIHFEPID